MAGVEEFDALLRQDFTAFIRKVFQTVDRGNDYRHNWHIEAIADHLRTHGAGTRGRLIITQPPRTLKSMCASVAYPAWAMGHDPGLKFICVSYSQDLADRFSEQFRKVVKSDWYQRAFPGMRLARDTSQLSTTTKGGSRLATSVSGTLRGGGGDVIIIDDPQKSGEENTEAERRRIIEWYRTHLVTRHDKPDTGSIILVMQRLHEEDLAGYLLNSGQWDHLDLPAEAQEDAYVPHSAGSGYWFAKGELLHPEHLSADTLRQRKAEMGSRAYSAQYLQRPVPTEGNLVKREWLENRYETRPQKSPGSRIVQSWDPASTAEETSAYSVGLTFLMDGDTYYLLDVLRKKLSYPELKRRIVGLAENYEADTLLVEKDGVGGHLIQDLRLECDTRPRMPSPIGRKAEGEKEARMDAATAIIEQGRLVLPREAPWLAEFEKELFSFPGSRTKDQVDALSQFLNWAKTRKRERRPFGGEVITAKEPPPGEADENGL